MNQPPLNESESKFRDRLLDLLLTNDRITVFAHDPQGVLFYFKGTQSEDLIGKSVFDLNHDWPSNIEAHHRALRGESFVTVGSVSGQIKEVKFTPVFDDQGRVTEVWGVSLNVSDRERHAREKELLIETGKMLAESFDYETTLERVCRLAVGPFADYSLIRLLDEEDQLQLVAVAHVDPHKEDTAFELHRRFTQKQSPNHPNFRVYQSGKTELITKVSDQDLVKYALDSQELQALRRLAPRAAIITPLVARGRMIGVISFNVTEDSGRNYSEADVPMAEELARRAALAVDNARLYEKEKK